jgi:hypothetical protein
MFSKSPRAFHLAFGEPSQQLTTRFCEGLVIDSGGISFIGFELISSIAEAGSPPQAEE